MTTVKIEPSHSKKRLLIIAGTCGILAPLIVWSLTALAIYYSPGRFDVAQNWLNDLSGMGYTSFMNVSRPLVSSPTTELLYQSGHIIGGILAIIFSIGLYIDHYTDDKMPSYGLGAVFGVIGSGALSVVGIFPEPMGVIQFVASFAFVLLISAAILLIGGALIDVSHKRLGGFSIALGIVALSGLSVVSYLRGSAQVIALLAISIWAIIFGIRMVWRASHQVEPT